MKMSFPEPHDHPHDSEHDHPHDSEHDHPHDHSHNEQAAQKNKF
jgi:hypothetical protein